MMHLFFLEFELKQKKQIRKGKEKKKKAIPVADQAKKTLSVFFSCWPQHATVWDPRN
jgi:hypothetical protein